MFKFLAGQERCRSPFDLESFICAPNRYRSVIGRELIDAVVKRRIDQIRDEARAAFPEAVIRHSIDPEGRGIISVTLNDFFLSQEFVETALTCERPERSLDYLRVLRDRMRLVIVVPESKANWMRLKMLQFNQWWLFYYLVFSYDEDGNIRKVGRPQPIGGPSDEEKGSGYGN